MHKGYLITLPKEFMLSMAGFDPKYLGTYHIIRSIVTPLFIILCAFWDALNSALKNSLKDIDTKQFFKLLVFLQIIFFSRLCFFTLKIL